MKIIDHLTMVEPRPLTHEQNTRLGELIGTVKPLTKGFHVVMESVAPHSPLREGVERHWFRRLLFQTRAIKGT